MKNTYNLKTLPLV